jgi:hypothetical protein
MLQTNKTAAHNAEFNAAKPLRPQKRSPAFQQRLFGNFKPGAWGFQTTLLVLVSILSELLLTLMGCNFLQFPLSSTGHLGDSFPWIDWGQYGTWRKKGQ